MWGSLQAKLHPDIQAWVWPGLSLVLTTVPTGGPNIQAECSARVNVMRKGAPEDALVITLESHRVSRDLFTRGFAISQARCMPTEGDVLRLNRKAPARRDRLEL